MDTSLLQILERVGFPIFVALWFMLRVEKRIEALIDAMKAVAQSQEILLREIAQHSGSQDPVPELVTPDNSRRRRLPTREG